MKRTLYILLIFLPLLVSQTGLALAQEPFPPVDLDETSLPKSMFSIPKVEGADPFDRDLSKEGISALATTPLVNGNFEQGRNVGWVEYSTHGWYLVLNKSNLNAPPHGGSWAAWLGGDDNDLSEIYQTNISITSPTRLRLWYWIGSQDSCGNDYGYVVFNSVTVYTWDLCSANNTGGWEALDLDLSAYSGQTASLIIAVMTNSTLNSNLFIDDVSLYSTFADVPFDFWSWQHIEAVYNAGITGGCGTSPLRYCPNNTVTRDQMAVFLLKAEHGSGYTPPAATGVFNDVPTSYWAAAWIEQLAAEGITGGCGGGNYCPTNPVNRAQMAVFLLKAEYGSAYTPPTAAGIFGDVPTSHWAADWIEQLAAESITGGCGGGNYCPTNPVNRAQMAVFLQKTFGLILP